MGGNPRWMKYDGSFEDQLAIAALQNQDRRIPLPYQRPYDPNGWNYYINHAAPKGVLCQFRNRHGEWIGYNDFHPEFNIADLQWKLTGIGKTQLEDK